MKRIALIAAVITSTLLAMPASFAAASCSRAELQHAVNQYLAAQTHGDTADLPLAKGLAYYENSKLTDIKTGLIHTPMKIDHHMSVIDPATCQSFTEVIVTHKAKPYVLGTRLRVNHGKIAEISMLWTTTGYWLFNADAYLKWAKQENWGPIPKSERDSRATLVAAANAYLDAFLEGNTKDVPWGYPCERTEGGAHTGHQSPKDTCAVGVPGGVNIVNRRFIVDPTIGVVVALCNFGVNGPADTHMFRVQHGKLRYVHTLTHLLQADFHGPLPRGSSPPGTHR